MKRVGLCLALAVGCLAIGCRKSTTVVDKDGTRATVTQSGGGAELKIEGKGGLRAQMNEKGGVALPDGFPKDVPIYPGSAVTMSASTKDGMQVVLKTPDPSDKVAAFYKEKLKGAGWELETSLSGEGSSMVSGKKDQRSVGAVVGRDSGGSAVTLMIQEPGK